MKLFKKLLVIVLCIALSLCAVPTTVIAEVKLTDPDMGTGDDIFGDIETFRPEVVDLTTRDDFGFGINVHNKSYAAYPEKYLEEQIHAVAKSGAKWIRINIFISKEDSWSYCDKVVGLANKYGLKIIMVISPDISLGLDYMTYCFKTFATRYNGENGRGFVDVFQAWNEIDIACMEAKYGANGTRGESENDYYTISVDNAYDLPEWLGYFKAAEKGIHCQESNSKFLVNFAATHHGFITYMLKNGLNLDYVGWDEYTYHPYDLEKSSKTLTEYLDKIQTEIYKKYNVPFIVCETNVFTTSTPQEERENPTLETHQALIDYMYIFYNRDWIKGAIFYELLDEIAFGNTHPESWFGLIYQDGSGEIKEENEKPIYKEITKLLKGNKNLPMVTFNQLDLTVYDEMRNSPCRYIVENGEVTIVEGIFYVQGVVAIPSSIDGYPVTAIGDNAFANCAQMTGVIIPKSIKSIGKNAFSRCYELKSIDIPKGVTSIGLEAFSWCARLKSVTIPKSVTVIDYSAFSNCLLLQTVNYGGSKTDWKKIKIYEENTCLTNATINYAQQVNHIYTNAHDEVCNDCGEKREVEPCVFTDSRDTKCDICGDIREIENKTSGYALKKIAVKSVSDTSNSYEMAPEVSEYDVAVSLEGVTQTWGDECHWIQDRMVINLENPVSFKGVDKIEFDIYIENYDNYIELINTASDPLYLCFNTDSNKYLGRAMFDISNKITHGGWNHIVLNVNEAIAKWGDVINFEHIYAVRLHFANATGPNPCINDIVRIANIVGSYAEYVKLPELPENVIAQLGNTVGNTVGDYFHYTQDRIFEQKLNPVDFSRSAAIEFDIYIDDYEKFIAAQNDPSDGNNSKLSLAISSTAPGLWGQYSSPRFYYTSTISLEKYITKSGWNHIAVSKADFKTLNQGVDWSAVTGYYVYYNGATNYAPYINANGKLYVKIANIVSTNNDDIKPFTYIIENGKVTITGASNDLSGVLNIPSTIEDCPVTTIGSGAFSGCSKITSVIIPNSVTIIESEAFKNCNGITQITIPKSVISISDSAFIFCSSLKTVNYGGSKADWNKILITYGNLALTYADFNYADGLGHIYTNSHDTKCNLCGDIREVECCVFTDNCDEVCDICGDVREAVHNFKLADCTSPKECIDCGVTQGTAIGHNMSDGTCILCGKSGIAHKDYINGEYINGYGWGDLDNDGLITMVDLELLNKSVCSAQFGDNSLACKAADVNGDSIIDMKDIVRIKKILGIIPGGGVGGYTTLTNIPDFLQ